MGTTYADFVDSTALGDNAYTYDILFRFQELLGDAAVCPGPRL